MTNPATDPGVLDAIGQAERIGDTATAALLRTCATPCRKGCAGGRQHVRGSNVCTFARAEELLRTVNGDHEDALDALDAWEEGIRPADYSTATLAALKAVTPANIDEVRGHLL